jgi:hypothetical protein
MYSYTAQWVHTAFLGPYHDTGSLQVHRVADKMVTGSLQIVGRLPKLKSATRDLIMAAGKPNKEFQSLIPDVDRLETCFILAAAYLRFYHQIPHQLLRPRCMTLAHSRSVDNPRYHGLNGNKCGCNGHPSNDQCTISRHNLLKSKCASNHVTLRTAIKYLPLYKAKTSHNSSSCQAFFREV